MASTGSHTIFQLIDFGVFGFGPMPGQTTQLFPIYLITMLLICSLSKVCLFERGIYIPLWCEFGICSYGGALRKFSFFFSFCETLFGFPVMSFALSIRMVLALCYIMAREGICWAGLSATDRATKGVVVRCCGISFKSGTLDTLVELPGGMHCHLG